jgi:hypothetical protein
MGIFRMKKAIFLVHRTNYYRFYTPLLEEAATRGYDVETWHGYSYFRIGVKRYTFPDIAYAPRLMSGKEIKTRIFQCEREFFESEELKKNLLMLDNSDVVISLHSPGLYWKDDTNYKLQPRWIVLCHGPDSFYELIDKKTSPFCNILFAGYTQKWIELGRDYLSKFSNERSSMLLGPSCVRIIGQPEFDTFSYIEDARAVRAKYGIPAERDILLYLPFPYQNWNPKSAWERAFAGLFMNTVKRKDETWDYSKKMPLPKKMFMFTKDLRLIFKDKEAVHYFSRGVNEVNVFKAVKKFCQKNNLLLVVKPRLKFPTCEYIRKHADFFVLDDETQNNPPRLKELLLISKLAISYYSLSVFSAAFASVYHINVTTPGSFFPDEKSKFFFSEKDHSFFNYSGVTTCLSPQNLISVLPQASLKDFSVDADRRKEYIRDFIGFDDYDSSKRIFDLLENKYVYVQR